MPTPSKPRRGSKGFGPRKRAESEVPNFRSWPESDTTELQGFAGYKAGMTHVLMVNDKPDSPREGMTESVPVTILETPPIKIGAVRAYRDTPYGKRPLTEVWTDSFDTNDGIDRALNVPEGHDPESAEEKIRDSIDEVSEIRAITYTLPNLANVPRRTPDVMETRIGGGSVEDRLEHGLELLGDEVEPDEIHRDGEYLDVSSITKGKGTQGPVKRWGVQLRKGKHARQGYKRRIGNLGPWHPSRVRSTVPQQGQTGYHQRTEVNKRLLSTGDDGKEVTPEGGITDYGEVKSGYMLVKGSVPGPKKRLVRTRKPVRPKGENRYDPEIEYISR
ncbi:50S ribosomal protein L3 [Halorutilales archaeon Cl-col2-1]